jgi:hypothetical protein
MLRERDYLGQGSASVVYVVGIRPEHISIK